MRTRAIQITVFVAIFFMLSILILLQGIPDNREGAIILNDEPLYWMEDANYGDRLIGKDEDVHDRTGVNAASLRIKHPVIIWWTPFTGQRGKIKSCDQETKCFFTVDRHFQNHPQTKAFLFYGSDFKPTDLPLPRKKFHDWALLHEESPKNNYILTHPKVIQLFNHTSTFQRTSDYPITTQYLPSLEALRSGEFLVPTNLKGRNGLAPLIYLHMDCDPPSDRDTYVKQLSKFIQIDSYGLCLHNKDLPEYLADPLKMDDPKLYKFISQYKFALAFENAVCNDYVTEKLWRPLIAGTVPVYYGSPTVTNWLPDDHSAILVSDFENPEELAKFLIYLDENDEEYDKYLEFKRGGITNTQLIVHMTMREWGVNNPRKINFITGFECFVCNRIHMNMERVKSHQVQQIFIADKNHLRCPQPTNFKFNTSRSDVGNMYQSFHNQDMLRADVLIGLLRENKNFTETEFQSRFFSLLGKLPTS